jgi:hypothetical protein
LKIEQPGIFQRGLKTKYYGHILPKEEWKKNIIEPYDTVFLNYIDEAHLHRYFHHLNSSQAMCINFFLPLIIENSLESMLSTLFDHLNGCEVINYAFEKESTIEHVKANERKTNFDFFVETSDRKKIYFEIKFTEKEFGTASLKSEDDNKKYSEKFERVYKDQLMSCPAISETYKEKSGKKFLENYQIMRNLIHIDEESYVIFIYPEGNKTIRDGAKLAKGEMVTREWSKHFIPVTWEQILDALMMNLDNRELLKYYDNHFKRKYNV